MKQTLQERGSMTGAARTEESDPTRRPTISTRRRRRSSPIVGFLAMAGIPLLCLLLGLGAAFVFQNRQEPVFVSKQVVLVQPQSPDSTIGRTNAGVLVDSYGTGDAVQTGLGFLQGDEVLRVTAQRLGTGVTPEQVGSYVTLERQGESRLIEVSARTPDPDLSSRTAQAYAQVALELHNQRVSGEARRLLEGGGGNLADEEIRGLTLVAQDGDPSLVLMSSAATGASQDNLSPALVLGAGAAVGLLIGLAVVMLWPRRRQA